VVKTLELIVKNRKKQPMNKPEIRSMIAREMKNRHVSGAELARGIHKHPSGVKGMLQRPTLQVGNLVQLCDFFQYNFFWRNCPANSVYRTRLQRRG